MHNEGNNVQILRRMGNPHPADDHIAKFTENFVHVFRLALAFRNDNRNSSDALIHFFLLLKKNFLPLEVIEEDSINKKGLILEESNLCVLKDFKLPSRSALPSLSGPYFIGEYNIFIAPYLSTLIMGLFQFVDLVRFCFFFAGHLHRQSFAKTS